MRHSLLLFLLVIPSRSYHTTTGYLPISHCAIQIIDSLFTTTSFLDSIRNITCTSLNSPSYVFNSIAQWLACLARDAIDCITNASTGSSNDIASCVYDATESVAKER